ncbi:MAG: DNA repair protein RecO [Spirulina sp. SIO3F2]|nr:DNA repair protein RecO [Spirulina sp. SIO3F2]
MSQTYSATGIILKSKPHGESDKLVTVLTPHFGVIRAIAPGARKPKSRLRGRTEIFVINQLLLVKGRSLDKLIQAETIESYPGLSRQLAKLAIAQYWAEVVLTLELSDQPHEQLYAVLCQRLEQLHTLPAQTPLAVFIGHLSRGLWQFLTWGGIAPSLLHCGLSGQPIQPSEADPDWRVGMSFELGSLIVLPPSQAVVLHAHLRSAEVLALQALQFGQLPSPEMLPLVAWRGVERVLRHYCQYHLGKGIRSAALLDTLFMEDF